VSSQASSGGRGALGVSLGRFKVRSHHLVLAAGVGSLSLVAGLGFAADRLSIEAALDQTGSQLQDVANSTAAAVDQQLTGARALTESYATRRALRGALSGSPVDANEVDFHVNQMRSIDGNLAFVVATTTAGNPVITGSNSVSELNELIRQRFTDSRWFQGVVERDGTYVSKVAPVAPSQDMIVLVATPVRPLDDVEGPAIGYLVAGYRGSAIQQVVSDATRASGADVLVLDASGAVVVGGTEMDQLPSGAGPTSDFISETQRSEMLGDRDRVLISSSSTSNGWIVAATISRNEALSAFTGLHQALVAITAVFGFIIVVGTATLFRVMRQWSRALRARAAALEEAEVANRSRTEFMSRISHELRTPLNAVLGFGQLLELDDLETDNAASVQHILRAGRHLSNIVDDVLEITSVGSVGLRFSVEPVAVISVLDEALALVRPMSTAIGVSVPSTGDLGQKFVFGDRQRLVQVFTNLISNAVKFNRPGGAVCVDVRCDGDRVVVDVADSGPGIAAEDLNRIFDPFHRLDTTRDTVPGTGLGLTLVKHLVEAMGGAVTATSTLGVGTTMTVELVGAVADEPPSSVGETPSNVGKSAVEGVLLYVEDNASNVGLMEQVISLRPGVRLLVAATVRSAVELARSHRPGMVLLDLHLRDQPGEEVLCELRADPTTASIPVVVLSADATVTSVQRLLAAGVEDYLTKPFEISRLLNLIDRILHVGATPGVDHGPVPGPGTHLGVHGLHHDILDADLLDKLRSMGEVPGRSIAALVELFGVQARLRLKELVEAHDTGDSSRVQLVAHDLKGSSGLFGVRKVSATAARIEALALTGRTGDLGAEIELLGAELDESLSALTAAFPEPAIV
jgi:signal transduction histidine kinase/CheY-like chemotaxis protein/HPt (histidine-containing phosphotransfer) domain-containing protein